MKLLFIPLLIISNFCYSQGITLGGRTFQTPANTTYKASTYFISNRGNTSNTGTSPYDPWPLSKVIGGANFLNGATILFNRGETYTGTVQTGGNTSAGMTESTRLTYGAYGGGTDPVITTMQDFPNWTVASNWRQVAGLTNVWALKITPLIPYTPRVWLNGTEYQRAKDSSQVNATRRTTWRNADFEYEYIYSVGNPTTYYATMQSTSFSTQSFMLSGQSYVTVRDLDIRGGNGASFDIQFCDHVTVYNCKIGKDGIKAGLRVNNIDQLLVSNDNFDTGERIMQDFNNSDEGGDGLLLGQGNTTNVEASNNYFLDWRHTSWLVEQDDSTKTLSNVRIHDNTATSPDVEYGRATSAYFYKATNVMYDHNVIRNIAVQNQFAGKGLVFSYNTIDTVRNNPYYTTGTGIGMQIGHQYFPPTNMLIQYNTIKNCYNAAIELNGDLGNTGSYANINNNDISYNVFLQNGTNVKQAIGLPSTDRNYFYTNTDIFIRDNVNVLANKYYNNQFGRLSTDKAIYYGHDPAKSYMKTVSEFNAMNGTAGDVVSGNVLQL